MSVKKVSSEFGNIVKDIVLKLCNFYTDFKGLTLHLTKKKFEYVEFRKQGGKVPLKTLLRTSWDLKGFRLFPLLSAII